MAIVSVSLPGETLAELDRLAAGGGFGGRSDAVRAAIRGLAKEHSQQRAMRGRVSGALLLAHDESDEQAFSEARHRFEGLIKMSVHNQLGGSKCLEIFILEGDASEVRELMKACRRSGKAEYVKLLIA